MGERMGEILTFRCFNADKPRLGLVQTFSSRTLQNSDGTGKQDPKYSKISLRLVPYLRNPWTCIDLIAILSFWITLTLAATGVERSASRHVGIFRALSVLRISRLLAITYGTAMHFASLIDSLKRARPLLLNVAYFVLFAVVLFR